jgi:hypothetical protein
MLLILLAIPLVAAVAGLVLSKGRFNWLEALVQSGVAMMLVGGGFFAARYAKTADTEIWNGRIVKSAGEQSCCHSYSCNCSTVCLPSCSTNAEGDSSCGVSCHEECDTCYEHSHDLYWSARTTNGETVFHDGCNPPGSAPPAAWARIVDGEPSAVEHSYINYVKGAPGKFFGRPWLIDRYKGKLPAYPRVYNMYRADRFLMSAIGEALPDTAALNRELSRINGNLGRAKQVNIIMVVTAEDPEFAEALSEAWLGGKKNDLIVVVGVPEFPRIGWVRVVSWTDARKVKDTIADRVMALGEFDGRKLLSVVEQEVAAKFKRKHMKDFRYLLKEIDPPNWAFWLLVTLGILVSGGLQAWFWVNDPFDKNKTTSSGSRRTR